jgi:hypothetical protein
MKSIQRIAISGIAALAAAAAPAPSDPGPSAAAPTLEYAFSARIMLAPAVEVGESDGGRRRFIAITGGTVYGPRLHGEVLRRGGDWQTILPGGLTRLDARYFLKASDGSIIEVVNPGVRTATPEVIERIASGDNVDPALYYFRTTPSFRVAGDSFAWMQRSAFVARGIRRPDHVLIDVYTIN